MPVRHWHSARPVTKPPPPLEAEIHASIVLYLLSANIPGLIFHHSQNEGRRGWRAQRWLKTSGTLTGWPDLIFLFRARAMLMEIKRPGEKLSDVQRAVHTRIADAGFMCCVVESLDQATKELAMFLKAARHATPHWGMPDAAA